MQNWIINYGTGVIIASLATWILARWKANEAGVVARAKTIDDWIIEKTGVNPGIAGVAAGVTAWVDANWGDARSVRQLLRTIQAMVKDPEQCAAITKEAEELISAKGEAWVSGLINASSELQSLNNVAKHAMAAKVLPSKVPDATMEDVHVAIIKAAPATVADQPSVIVRSDEVKKMIEEVRAKAEAK